MRCGRLVYIPFWSVSSERALEDSKTNGVIGNGVGRTPHVEGVDMVGRILSSITLKFWDVLGKLSQHSKPTSILVYGVIYQLAKIR